MKSFKSYAQSTIEFTFVLIVIFFLVYGLIRIFRWAGMDLAERRWAYDQHAVVGGADFLLTSEKMDKLDNVGIGTARPYALEVYRPKRINGFVRCQ